MATDIRPTDDTASAVWFIMLGIILFLCGLFALLAPFASTLAVTAILGGAAALAGIAQVVQAFGARAWRGVFASLLLGLLYIACGMILWLNLVAGALAITATLAVLLFVGGAGEIVLGLRARPERGWLWFIVSGLVGLAAGAWLMLRLPVSGLVVPGLALGVTLLFEGGAFVALGLNRKKGRNRVAAPASAGGR